MARKRRTSDVLRMLLRRLPQMDDAEIWGLRDRVESAVVTELFKRGATFDGLKCALRRDEPNVEAMVRRVMNRGGY